MLKFRWEIVLGGEVIDVAELERIADEKRVLIRLRGRLIYFDPKKYSAEALAAIVERLRSQPEGELSPLDALLALLGQDAHLNGIPIETECDEELSNTGWFSRLMLQTKLDDIGRPAGLSEFIEGKNGEALRVALRDYQQHGLNWLAFMSANGFGALLADDMGLGKTLQTLAWLQHRRNQGATKPCLLICPTSLMNNWEKEAKKFAPNLRLAERHHGSNRAKTDVALFAQSRGRDLVITTYGCLRLDQEILTKVEWDAVILDEAQTIKTPDTAISKAAREVARGIPFRLALSGTPIENRVTDLWTQFDFLNPGLLGTLAEFKKTYAPLLNLKSPNLAKTPDGVEAGSALRRITSPFMLRRLKTDPDIAATLPPKIERVEECHLTKEQAELYRAVQKEAESELETAKGAKRNTVILEILLKLKQACNHPAHLLKDKSPLADASGFIRSDKLSRLVVKLEYVLAAGEKALVFTQYAEMGSMLDDFLGDHFGDHFKVGTQFMSGKTPQHERDKMVEKFDKDPRFPIFILTQKVGGVGLNLQAANHVFHYDRWWNPAVEDQCTDRAFRIGQTNTVNVHKLVCVGTLEERIADLIARKRELANLVIEETDSESFGEKLASMSNDELRDFFSLSPNAVADE